MIYIFEKKNFFLITQEFSTVATKHTVYHTIPSQPKVNLPLTSHEV